MAWLAYAENIGLDLTLVAIYFVAIAISKSKEIAVCLLASLASNIYCLSPFYTYTVETSPQLAFLVYASIYFTAMNFLSSYKVLSACFIMAVFEIIMYKAYLNELGHKGIENGLYDNYEYIVTLLHLNILLSMVRWDIVRSTYRSIRDNLLRPFLHERCLLPY